MSSESQPILGVPTNIITGFLGVGKTSAILNLMANKPENERWAVLVNEFGEIGVDGSLVQGQQSEEQQVFIREVPGGCMCCAAGLPMQIALNQLLNEAKPDRLLIEPTGLTTRKKCCKCCRQIIIAKCFRYKRTSLWSTRVSLRMSAIHSMTRSTNKLRLPIQWWVTSSICIKRETPRS